MSSSEEQPRTLIVVHTRTEEPLVYLCPKGRVIDIQSKAFTNPGWEPRCWIYSLAAEESKDLLTFSGAHFGGLLLKKEWSSISGTLVQRHLEGILQAAGNEGGFSTRKQVLEEAVAQLNQELNFLAAREEATEKHRNLSSTGN